MKRYAALILVALAACQSTPPLAPNTSLKAYEKEVMRRMNVVWSRLSARDDALVAGTAKLQFQISPNGRVSNLKVIANSGNEALAGLGRRTVYETSIPPIPRAALAELPGGYMPVDCSFTAYYTD